MHWAPVRNQAKGFTEEDDIKVRMIGDMNFVVFIQSTYCVFTELAHMDIFLLTLKISKTVLLKLDLLQLIKVKIAVLKSEERRHIVLLRDHRHVVYCEL